MSIKIGSTDLFDCYVGSTAVSAVYAGRQILWVRDSSGLAKVTFYFDNKRPPYSSTVDPNEPADLISYADDIYSLEVSYTYQGKTQTSTYNGEVVENELGDLLYDSLKNPISVYVDNNTEITYRYNFDADGTGDAEQREYTIQTINITENTTISLPEYYVVTVNASYFGQATDTDDELAVKVFSSDSTVADSLHDIPLYPYTDDQKVYVRPGQMVAFVLNYGQYGNECIYEGDNDNYLATSDEKIIINSDRVFKLKGDRYYANITVSLLNNDNNDWSDGYWESAIIEMNFDGTLQTIDLINSSLFGEYQFNNVYVEYGLTDVYFKGVTSSGTYIEEVLGYFESGDFNYDKTYTIDIPYLGPAEWEYTVYIQPDNHQYTLWSLIIGGVDYTEAFTNGELDYDTELDMYVVCEHTTAPEISGSYEYYNVTADNVQGSFDLTEDNHTEYVRYD